MLRQTQPRLRAFLGSVPQYVQRTSEQAHPSPVPVDAGRIAPPTPFVPDVPTLLKLIGRNASSHATKFPTWESFFVLTSDQLKKLGVNPPRMRRYLLQWRDRFRRGQYGVGGDLTEVVDGVAELRIVEVPVAKDSSGGHGPAVVATTTSSPGMKKIVVNVKPGAKELRVPLELVKPVTGMKVKDAHCIRGPFAQHVKGTRGAVARLEVKEAMWEHRRGNKVDGGERRQAEVRAKKRRDAKAAAEKNPVR